MWDIVLAVAVGFALGVLVRSASLHLRVVSLRWRNADLESQLAEARRSQRAIEMLYLTTREQYRALAKQTRASER